VPFPLISPIAVPLELSVNGCIDSGVGVTDPDIEKGFEIE